MKPSDDERTGESLPVAVKCSPKKVNVKSLPKIAKKKGNKLCVGKVCVIKNTAHFFAITVGSEVFYVRRTALEKLGLCKASTTKLEKKVAKNIQQKGETKGRALIKFAQDITFSDNNAQKWIEEKYGELF